ncbi:hypothetical protein BCT11_14920 [Vibrio sp. 10N.222.52.B12]|uniref:hypothetical protein n=1 Tax=Vibrio sp. 10N.222.52.B12 TaxID=1880840 RepID=UPI000C820DFD|nr:hypothetical protein [Vibrio sp. 10N.222.52.B12]PMO39581.1 hypothetical protein BCT11_14920 [Vibrio sp. 10N.222.52.B12]
MKKLNAREAFSYMWGARRSNSIPAIHYAFGRLVDTFGAPEATKLALYIDNVKFHSFHSREYKQVDTNSLTNFEFNTTAPSGLRSYALYQAIKRNNAQATNEIRKQDEAPQVGADSSFVEA